MNSVNKTMYIPLYGKAYVSKKGIILKDKKAEEIWSQVSFKLKGKSKSKWLAYFLGMRAAVFDKWVLEKSAAKEETAILHIGCGLDSRVLRVNAENSKWYDVDFAEVIKERKRYYGETENYRMLTGDAGNPRWLSDIPEASSAVVILEGISMYLEPKDIQKLMKALKSRFDKVFVMMDCYTELAAKLSEYRNPVKDVGVTKVYGADNPKAFETHRIKFFLRSTV